MTASPYWPHYSGDYAFITGQRAESKRARNLRLFAQAPSVWTDQHHAARAGVRRLQQEWRAAQAAQALAHTLRRTEGA
jgi:hypothetical protein